MGIAEAFQKFSSKDCDLCHKTIPFNIGPGDHFVECAENLGIMTSRSRDPVSGWKEAIAYDRASKLSKSQTAFERSSQLFLESASKQNEIARVLFEYSTLMDALSKVQKARELKQSSNFSDSLSLFSAACEMLRATVNFSFLAPYVSGCASMEVTDDLTDDLDNCFQGYKNCVALFEQAKLALVFRDEFHRLMKIIDAYVKISMSKAVRIEGKILLSIGSSAVEVQKKAEQAVGFSTEAAKIAAEAGYVLTKLEYFPVNDFARIEDGAYILAFPEGANLRLLNLGANEARVRSIGRLGLDISISPKRSVLCSADLLGRGKIRVRYADLLTAAEYDEGCLSLV